MPNLSDMQDEFAEALLSATTPVPSCLKGSGIRRADRRFAVYRNNVAASLIEALGARFPVVKRLVGEEFFSAMAHAFVLREPPFSPLLIHYGETFAAFIAEFEEAKPLPYLADVARFEFARGVAYHAADAEPLPRAAFASLAAGGVGAVRVTLHPSVGIVASAYPVLSIWEVNQATAVKPVSHWGPEAALVARPFLEVETRRIGAGTAAFLAALRGGSTIAEAEEIATAAVADFNASDGLAVLIGAHLATSLDVQ
ncbi:MAG TPA: DNA-binding domain-containing protein [Methyloceanibacter sp.]|nr:DNA-binding domain-containing protein [Methyloceanibacter sp.]